MSSPTELLLREALTHLYLHREDPSHRPSVGLYARIEKHLQGPHTGGIAAPATQYVPGEAPNPQDVPVVYCKECGGAKYPWLEYHDEDCSHQHL